MPRKEKCLHYIYKTTCIITNKWYIGMHSSDNINDGYLGSGKILKRSLNKHGKDNHKIEILEFCKTRELLFKKEKEIITSDLLKESLCMNLKIGGAGSIGNPKPTGWKMPPMTEEHRKNLTIARNNRDPHSQETKDKMSTAHKGKIRTEEHIKNNTESIRNSKTFKISKQTSEHRALMSQRTSDHWKIKKELGIKNTYTIEGRIKRSFDRLKNFRPHLSDEVLLQMATERIHSRINSTDKYK